MKIIETRYKGHRFRSRLEARWAVFFDALGLEWAYEPEGYQLHNGELYLPDFFLPDPGIFVEIKGTEPTASEIERCMWLSDGSGTAVLLVSGLPFEKPSTLFAWDLCDSSGGSYQTSVTMVWPASRAAEVITHDDSRVDRDRQLYLKFFTENPIDAHFEPFNTMRPPQKFAADAARSARFEHGQKGAR